MSNAATSPEDLVSFEIPSAADAITSDALDKMSSQINEIRTAQSSPKESLVASPATSDLPALAIVQERELVALKKLEPGEAMNLAKKLVQLEPLSRTENLLYKGLQSEINKGSLEGTQEMLRAIAENPASAARVLNEFKLNQELNDLRSVNYIIGTDANGKPFIQLSITQRDNHAKSSPSTTVTMDNRGDASATRVASVFKPPFSVDPAKTLNQIYRPNPLLKR